MRLISAEQNRGGDCDKIAEASLTPIFSSEGNPAFEQAGLVLECKKLYAGMLRGEEFLDTHILTAAYGLKGKICTSSILQR